MSTTSRDKIISATPSISGVRELSRQDLTHLAQPRPPGAIRALRDNHHRVARALASGLSIADTAAFCGLSTVRVTQLRADPAFQELISHYRGLVTDEWVKAADPVIDFLSSVRTKALAQIEAKLEAADESGEFLPSRDLATFAELGLDRTGYGKVNKNLNINVDFAANMERIRKRRDARQIEAPPEPQSAPTPLHASPPGPGPSLLARRL